MTKLTCPNCGKEFEVDCTSCGTWTCPGCGNVNLKTETEPDENDDWLKTGFSVCDFLGPEVKLPAGGYYKVKDLMPEDLAYRWFVNDAESEEGWYTVKKAQLTKSMDIVGVALNPKSVAKVVEQYGEDFVMISDAGTGNLMMPSAWDAKYAPQWDAKKAGYPLGLALVALRNMRLALGGTGVVAHPWPRQTSGGVITHPRGSGRQPNQLGDKRNR